MKALYLCKRVGNDGSLTLTDLPPDLELEITLKPRSNAPTLTTQWAEWCADVRQTHDFATMTRDDVLAALQRTRDEVARDLYGD